MRAKADLAGKVAVITGGASGIGRALALRAAQEGMKVALAGVDESLLAGALVQVHAQDVAAIAVRTDVSDVSAVHEFARRTEAELGPPWLVCNDSDVSTLGLSGNLSPMELKHVMDVNLWSVINGVQVFAPGMTQRDAGHIVNLASATARFGIPGTAPYVSTIHAILGLSQALYRELDSTGSQVGVTVVCPALMITNVTSDTGHQPGTRPAAQIASSVPSLARNVPLQALPPRELAEQIFAAVTARRFLVPPHARPAHDLPGGIRRAGTVGRPHRVDSPRPQLRPAACKSSLGTNEG